jgi:hypothetical protein
MGRLRQATFRWTAASRGLCRLLHSPGGHFQSSDRRHGRWPSVIHLERLSRQQSAENHAPHGGRVHRAVFAARPTERVPPHSLLRVLRQSTPQREVRALPPTSRHGSSKGRLCRARATRDYRDRYERLTGRSLRECPVCHRGRMIAVKALPQVRSSPTIRDTS